MASAAPSLQILGAILAGGQSSRMGTTKSCLKLDGRPVLKILAERLRPICFRAVVVCRDAEQAASLALPPELSAIFDAVSGRGPLGGLHAALAFAGTDAVLLLGCDVPFVETPLLGKLVERFQRDQPIALLPRTPSTHGSWQPQPLCSIWSHAALPHVETALRENRLSLYRLAGEIGAAYVDLSNDESRQLRNVNTREELRDGLTL